MTDTLVNIAPGRYIDPASVESIEVWPTYTQCGCPNLGFDGQHHEKCGGPYNVIRVTTHGGRTYEHAGALGDGTRYWDEADAIVDADKLAQLLMMPDQALWGND